MRGKRKYQVAGQIKTEISEVIRSKMSDNRIGFVTLTDVEMSDDLRYAKVFFSVLGDASRMKETQKVLTGARPFIRSEVAAKIRIRYMPEISFHADESLAYGARIQELLNSVEEDLTGDEDS